MTNDIHRSAAFIEHAAPPKNLVPNECSLPSQLLDLLGRVHDHVRRDSRLQELAYLRDSFPERQACLLHDDQVEVRVRTVLATREGAEEDYPFRSSRTC